MLDLIELLEKAIDGFYSIHLLPKEMLKTVEEAVMAFNGPLDIEGALGAHLDVLDERLCVDRLVLNP